MIILVLKIFFVQCASCDHCMAEACQLRRTAQERGGEELPFTQVQGRQPSGAPLRRGHGRLDAWTAGDIAALDQQALQPMLKSSPRLYQVLITQRNAAWVKTIRARLSGSGRTVMVVGIGHLIGPGGVPALLRAEGVAVDGP